MTKQLPATRMVCSEYQKLLEEVSCCEKHQMELEIARTAARAA